MGRGATRQKARPAPSPLQTAADTSASPPSCASAGSRGPTIVGRRTITVEALGLAGPQVDDLPLAQLQLLQLGAGQLRPDLGAVAEHELDPDLEAEGDDPLHHRLLGALVGVEHDLHVVRAHVVLAEPVDLADEAHHELVGGVLVEVVGAARLLDPALVHHHQLLGDVHRLLLVVGDEDRRHVHLLVEVAQPGAQVLADLGVERAEGLVEQQHLRLRPRAPGPGPCAGAGRRRAGRGSGRRARRAGPAAAARGRGRRSSAFFHLRIFSPKPTFSNTVMCLKAA